MTEPERLTEAAHWDAVHRDRPQGSGARRAAALLGRERATFLYRGGYLAHVIAERTLGPHLRPGLRIVEVGSAPGLILAKLATRFQCDPWGIDYSDDGVRANRETFVRFGFDPDHVIQGDFFSDALIDRHRASFDVVTSGGFIEHFSDVHTVVARHVALLKPGGLLSITIPNLNGVNAALTRFFQPSLLAAHNRDIMHADAFAALFEGHGLTRLHCGYVGVFHIGLQAAPPGSLKQRLLRACNTLQLPLELLQRSLFDTRSPQLPWLSPYLHYVGRLRD